MVNSGLMVKSVYIYIYILFGALEPWNFMTFHILGIVTPTDFHIFQRGRSTTNQLLLMVLVGNVILFLLAGAPYDQ